MNKVAAGSPQRHGGHGVIELFFVYREMPIDEKNLSNQNNETLFFMDLLAQIDDQQRYSFIMLSM